MTRRLLDWAGWALIAAGGRLLRAPHLAPLTAEKWCACTECGRWEPWFDSSFAPDLSIVCAECIDARTEATS